MHYQLLYGALLYTLEYEIIYFMHYELSNKCITDQVYNYICITIYCINLEMTACFELNLYE